MRLLHFVHGYLPRHRGGTESYVAELVAAQLERGHAVAVATGTEDGAEVPGFERTRERGHEVFRIRRTGLYLDSWQSILDPEAEAVALDVAREFRPDLVHVHHWRRLGSGLIRRLRAEGIPVVVTLHDLSTTCARSFRVRDETYCERPPVPASCRDCIDRFWYQDDAEIDARIDLWREEMVAELAAASLIVAPSRALAEEVALRLAPEAPELSRRMAVLPLGTIGSGQPGRPGGEVARLAFWGALQPMKGAHLLLQALGKLRRRDWELDLWGDLDAADPLYRERLEQLMKDLPVRRRGSFMAFEIPGHYDLAIFPSIALESHSFAVDEAFQRGIPVLVPDRGAPAERVAGAGLTFRAENVRDLTRQLDRLIGDQDLLEDLKSRVPAPQSMKAHAADLAALYDEAMDEGRTRVEIDDSARARFFQRVLRRRDGELWRTRGRIDQERDRADALQFEVEDRDEEIRRRDEILSEFNANLSRVSAVLAEREQELAGTTREQARIEAELRAEIGNRDRDDKRREAVLVEFKNSTDQFRQRLSALESERDTLTARCRELEEAMERNGEAALVVQQDLEAAVEIERKRRGELDAEIVALATEREAERGALHEENARIAAELSQSHAQIAAVEAAHAGELAALKAAEVELQSRHRDELGALTAQLAAAEGRSAELGGRLEEAEKGRERLRRMAANLRAETEAEQERLALTSAALDRALEELEDSQDERRQLAGRLLESLEPIVRECGVTDAGRRPAEELIDFAVANHGRLHELIAQRDCLLQELVLRIDDYERRLGPAVPEVGVSGGIAGAAGIRRRIARLKRRIERRREGDRMRILIVVHDFLPRHNAGTEIYTYNLARELAARHDVHLIFCEARHEQERYTVSKGVIGGLPYTEVVHNYQWANFEETYCDPRMEEIFADLLDDFEPDLVHIQHLHYFSMGFIDLAKDRGLPVAYTLHEFLLLCARGGQLLREDMEICELPVPEKCADCIRHETLAGDYGQDEGRRARERVADLLPESLQRAFEGFAGPRRPEQLDAESRVVYAKAAAARLAYIKERMARVDLFISPSAFLRERFIAAGMVEPDRIIHSDNGFDTSPFHGVERRPSKTLRFGFVGTIAPYKGIHVMVEAMNGIRDAGVELQVWGDIETFQEYKQELLPLIDNPAIKLMGRFDNGRIAEVLAGIDVLIVPSLWFENSPLTIHEAWLAGIPVIASDRGGMAELVSDGENGFHFRLGDAADLRQKMRRFIADPSLAPKMGARPGPVKAIADNARELEAIYQGLLGSVAR